MNAPDASRSLLDKLEYLRVVKIGDCTRCKLHLHRTRIVFGEGSPQARVMFVGEAPGAHEDATGRPFVGRSGNLLDQWIAKIGLRRSDVYITNVVKCRPLDNRDPYPDEKQTCSPFLHVQIALIRPRLLVALGRHAANALAGTSMSMEELQTTRPVYEKRDLRVPVVPVFHPSYVLRRGRGATETLVLRDLSRAVAECLREDPVPGRQATEPQKDSTE